MARDRKKTSVLGRAALVFVSVSLSLLLGEYLALPLNPKISGGRSRHAYLLGFTAKPNILVDDVPINSDGFTGPVLAKERPPGVVRILTLGGSSMFNRCMTERLFVSLSRASAANIQIQGGALRTHTTRSSLIKYEAHFSQYRFDYVLIYHAVNDLWANHVATADFREDYSHLGPRYARNFLLDHSVLARMLYDTFWSKPTPVHNGANFRAERTFESNLRELIRLIRNDGGVPILMTFAWHIPDDYSLEKFVAGELDYNNPTHYDECVVESWGKVDYVKEGLNRHNAVLKRIAAEEDVLILDQCALLGDHPAYFGDFCHLSEEGTNAFIEQITAFCLERRLLPPAN